MALAHMNVKVGKVGKGTPHSDYIARQGEYAEKLERGEVLEATSYGNMPEWAKDNPRAFWQAADLNERKNGAVYREFEIALPRELTADQRKELVEAFIQQELGEKHAYQYAIHSLKALDDDEQPHVHLMFSERTQDGIERDPEQYFKRYNAKFPERGGCQKANTAKTSTERKEDLKQLRARWEQLHNAHMRKHGHTEQISMKSYADQGIDLPTEQHHLPSEWRKPDSIAKVTEFRQLKAEIKLLTTEQLPPETLAAISAHAQKQSDRQGGLTAFELLEAIETAKKEQAQATAKALENVEYKAKLEEAHAAELNKTKLEQRQAKAKEELQNWEAQGMLAKLTSRGVKAELKQIVADASARHGQIKDLANKLHDEAYQIGRRLEEQAFSQSEAKKIEAQKAFESKPEAEKERALLLKELTTGRSQLTLAQAEVVVKRMEENTKLHQGSEPDKAKAYRALNAAASKGTPAPTPETQKGGQEADKPKKSKGYSR